MAGRLIDCRCALTSNLFSHRVGRHFRFEGEAAFRAAHADYLRRLGAHEADALVAELEAEVARRAALPVDSRARREAIAAGYTRRHPEIFELRAEWLDPRFVELAQLAREDPSALRALGRGAGALDLRRVPALLPVYDMPVLSDAFCERICAELDAFEAAPLPKGRPNSMNNYGVLLDELGFGDFLAELLAAYIRPVAGALFGEAGGAEVDSHKSFVVRYRMGEDEGLALHYDNAEVTLNVNIGREFEGGELMFGGHSDEGSEQEPRAYHAHARGRGVLHLGAHMHQALPILAGERLNFVVWARAAPYRRRCGCPMCGRTDQLIDPAADEGGARGVLRSGGEEKPRARAPEIASRRGAAEGTEQNHDSADDDVLALLRPEQIDEFMRG